MRNPADPLIGTRCDDCGAYCYTSPGLLVHRNCEAQDGGGQLVPLPAGVELDECMVCHRLFPPEDLPGLYNYIPGNRLDPPSADGPICLDCCERENAREEAARESHDEMDYQYIRPRGQNPLEDH